MRYGFYLPTRGADRDAEALETIVQRGEALGFSLRDDRRPHRVPVAIASKYPYTVGGRLPRRRRCAGAARAHGVRRGQDADAAAGHQRDDPAVPEPRGRRPRCSPPSTCSRAGGSPSAWAWAGSARSSRRSARRTSIAAARSATSTCASSRRCGPRIPAAFEGEFYGSETCGACPSPCRSRIRRSGSVATARPALRRVARLGDGWHPVGANPAVPLTPAELRASLDELPDDRGGGRDPAALTISFKAPLYDTAATTLGGVRRPFLGTPQQVAEDIGTYEQARRERADLRLPERDLAETLDRMERFAQTMRTVR